MKAALFEEFAQPLSIREAPDPIAEPDGVVIRVAANGVCRSDWHGWMGHDPDIALPHVPGHELAGVVESVGDEVSKWQRGDRVTLPFSCGCGRCAQCLDGFANICDNYFQPGFTAWGGFAQLVAVKYADVNLVRLPESMSFVAGASLGCRFITAFRAVVDQGQVGRDQWVAVYGCGGVGLSAIMIARAVGARVVAVDINRKKLDLARSLGAEHVIDVSHEKSVVDAVVQLTDGGAHVSIDALGSTETAVNSILSLRKRGKHIQVGLMVAGESNPPLPLATVIARELEIIGSHGMQATRYDEIFGMIADGKLNPEALIGKTISLEESAKELEGMGSFQTVGVTVIDQF